MRGFRACARHGGLFLDRSNEWRPSCGGQFVMLTPPANRRSVTHQIEPSCNASNGVGHPSCCPAHRASSVSGNGLACCAAAGPLTRPPADSSNRLSGRDRIDSPGITSRADPAESCQRAASTALVPGADGGLNATNRSAHHLACRRTHIPSRTGRTVAHSGCSAWSPPGDHPA